MTVGWISVACTWFLVFVSLGNISWKMATNIFETATTKIYQIYECILKLKRRKNEFVNRKRIVNVNLMIYYAQETERKISFYFTPDSIESNANGKQGQHQKPISIQFIFKFFHSLFYPQEYFILILKFAHVTRPHTRIIITIIWNQSNPKTMSNRIDL